MGAGVTGGGQQSSAAACAHAVAPQRPAAGLTGALLHHSPSSTAPMNSKIDATSTACQYLSALADTEVPNAFAYTGQGVVDRGWAGVSRDVRALLRSRAALQPQLQAN